jgi:hypothetical protein
MNTVTTYETVNSIFADWLPCRDTRTPGRVSGLEWHGPHPRAGQFPGALAPEIIIQISKRSINYFAVFRIRDVLI